MSVGLDEDYRPVQKPQSFKHQEEEHMVKHQEPEVIRAPSLTPPAPLPPFMVPSEPLNQQAEDLAPGQVYSLQEEAPEPAAAPPPPPPPEDDPWAALQAQYNPNANKKSAVRKSGMDDDDDDFEMVAPGVSAGSEIEAEYALLTRPQARGSKAATPSATAHSYQQSAPPAQKPKGGDWGNGDLALAGTLMLNETESAPPPSKFNQSLRKPAPPPVEDYAVIPKQAKLDDLGVADFDQSELDALMDDIEPADKMGDELAAKLARFEALDDD